MFEPACDGEMLEGCETTQTSCQPLATSFMSHRKGCADTGEPRARTLCERTIAQHFECSTPIIRKQISRQAADE